MDGQLHSRRVRDDSKSGTTEATRELRDVAARVRDMDNLGVAHQVLFPTVLLNELTERADLDVAMCSSYNRWVAARCAESGGRMRFVAVLPYSSMHDAVEELVRAKHAGAIGVFKRGVECARSASDPYFFPVYEKAAELDLPLCIHTSLPWAAIDAHVSRVRPVFSLGIGGFTVLQAFFAMLTDHVPETFPRLRIGFIEAGSSWLPYLLDAMQYRGERKALFEDKRLFVTCEAAEDLGYILSQVGDEALFVGTDYSHGDRASVMYAHQKIHEHAGVSDKSAEKITSTNALDFYHFD
jgi:predicted TIM-barrel fold metal-dependent hydrolase